MHRSTLYVLRDGKRESVCVCVCSFLYIFYNTHISIDLLARTKVHVATNNVRCRKLFAFISAHGHVPGAQCLNFPVAGSVCLGWKRFTSYLNVDHLTWCVCVCARACVCVRARARVCGGCTFEWEDVNGGNGNE